MEKVSGAIMNKFQFSIENTSDAVKKLAIIPAYHSTIGVDIVKKAIKNISEFTTTTAKAVVGVDFTGETTTDADFLQDLVPASTTENLVESIEMHRHNTAALFAAGYPVDVILDDATVEFEDESTFVMASGNPAKRICDFLDFIKTNPQMLKEMTIISDDISVFSTDMEVAKLNPFTRSREALIDMNKFVDKYQNLEDRINITFDEPLEISDVLLWTMSVPAGAKMDIILRF